MKSVDEKYTELKNSKYSMDFDPKSINWKTIAEKFVFDRKNDYIADFIKKVHSSK